MIGFRPRPFIFVHIPRTGGTSIEHALWPHMFDNPEWKTFDGTPPEVRREFWTDPDSDRMHAYLSEYEKQFNSWDFLVFTVVRNPWDRVLSLARWLAGTGDTRWNPLRPLKQRIRNVCALTPTRDRIHGSNQASFIYRPRHPYRGRILKYEDLHRDWISLCVALEIDPKPLPHTKRTNPANEPHAYREAYDSESKGWVEHVYSEDIKRFHYSF